MKLIRIGNTIINADHIREAYVERDGPGAVRVQLMLPDPYDVHVVEFHAAQARALLKWLEANAEELPIQDH